jgi:hypothetical protein
MFNPLFDNNNPQAQQQSAPFQIAVPGMQQAVGFGDAIAGLFSSVGVQPCTPCEARKTAMNARVQFVPWSWQ